MPVISKVALLKPSIYRPTHHTRLLSWIFAIPCPRSIYSTLHFSRVFRQVLALCPGNLLTAPVSTMSSHPQDEVQQHSLNDPESFWAEQASHLHWHKKPSSILTKSVKSLSSGTEHDHWEWFSDGEISTCYNCVDRHVLAGNGDQTAIIWDSPVTKTKEKYTYSQVLSEVETFAGVLREEGVKRGDVVLIYSEHFPAWRRTN